MEGCGSELERNNRHPHPHVEGAMLQQMLILLVAHYVR